MLEPYPYDEFMHDTGHGEFHSVQTIELGELIESGVFTWERVPWASAAYSAEQYKRVCDAFELRFWAREIGITPVGLWFKKLTYKIVYDLMPKYRPLYAQVESGDYDPLQDGGNYSKERRIDSDFPETLLSNNQDYASKGYDLERETIGRGNFADAYANYAEKVVAIDVMILNEIEKELFTSLYTTNVNGW